MLARVVVAVIRDEEIDRAVIVEVGGEDRLAVAADVERGEGRVLDEAAVAVAQEETRERGGVVDVRVRVADEVDAAIAIEVGGAAVAVDATRRKEAGKPCGGEVDAHNVGAVVAAA